ncbi:FK506-binding protein 15 [Mytilus galloprovincialis]|uniref:FK506-binding protein 15 n=1 Tax=Mytilus galloprovincialis TaxID=29158 RepID=A0A8B6C0D5_MYTGA|nr:FK506-binding protein 15 [Mytilus galloprovincialis]
MFFSAEDDDQDFVSGGSKSRLANLFGIDKQSSQGGNESLTYTAPKQPRPKEPAPQTEGAPGVLFASAVNAYKYVDGKYATQGKLGAAILANHTSLDYRILLYVSKQQQVTNAKITTAFTFTVQPNNYAIIYDDSRLTWSLNFDSEQNVQLFAKNVALAKALSAGSALETVISQDLNVGEGSSSVETGSSVEVKYTGWLLTNNTFGQVLNYLFMFYTKLCSQRPHFNKFIAEIW